MPASDPSGRRWLAIFPPLSIVLLILGGALTATGLDRPATSVAAAVTQLQIAARHPGQLFLANLLVILGLGALGVSFVVIASFTAGRPGRRGALAAGAIGCFACFCGAVVNVLLGINLAGAATAHAAPEAAARVLVSIDTAWVAVVLLVAYLAGLLLASVLTGLSLWRSRGVGRPVAIAFPIALLVAGAAPPGIANVVLSLPIAVVMALLARQIWRATAPDAAPYGYGGHTRLSPG